MSRSGLYISAAFLAGFVLAITLKDVVVPRWRRRKGRNNDFNGGIVSRETAHDAKFGETKDGGSIAQGIEGTIGNTPLVRIKSLSEATGCEILAKAEVYFPES